MPATKINGWLKFIILAATVVFAAGGLTFAVRMNTEDIEEIDHRVSDVELAQQAIPFIQEDIREIKDDIKTIASKM